jgi:hypothetical protein
VALGSSVTHGPGPHFICIGPQNSATTWIADQLKFQWDFWMPPIQEASYLKALFRPGMLDVDLDLHWDWWSIIKRVVRNRSLLPGRDAEYFRVARELSTGRGDLPDLADYQELFAPARGQLTGDVAPIYASFSIGEIRDRLPMLQGRRIFMMARDPVQRFWSAMSRYRNSKAFGDVDYGSPEIARLLFNDPQRSRQNFPTQVLERWEGVLGKGQIRVFFFDDVAEHPRQVFRQILEFIGGDIRHRLPLVPLTYNRKSGAPKVQIAPEARAWVRAAFTDELARCAERFGTYGRRWQKRHTQPLDPVTQMQGVKLKAFL